MKSFIVYRTTNLINRKIYIGICSSGRKDYLGSGVWLRKAILKYGRNNFTREDIEICATYNELLEREIYWIDYYQSMKASIGYNLHKGGLGGERTKQHQEKLNRAYKKAKTNGSYNRKMIVQIDLKNGSLIKVWDCITMAAKEFDAAICNISKVCKGTNYSICGYGWMYLGDYINNGWNRVVPFKKPVDILEAKTNRILWSFDSINDAAEFLNIHKTSISKAIERNGSFYKKKYKAIFT